MATTACASVFVMHALSYFKPVHLRHPSSDEISATESSYVVGPIHRPLWFKHAQASLLHCTKYCRRSKSALIGFTPSKTLTMSAKMIRRLALRIGFVLQVVIDYHPLIPCRIVELIDRTQSAHKRRLLSASPLVGETMN
eukprot:1173402-Amphidinium_carterae.1